MYQDYDYFIFLYIFNHNFMIYLDTNKNFYFQIKFD